MKIFDYSDTLKVLYTPDIVAMLTSIIQSVREADTTTSR